MCVCVCLKVEEEDERGGATVAECEPKGASATLAAMRERNDVAAVLCASQWLRYWKGKAVSDARSERDWCW